MPSVTGISALCRGLAIIAPVFFFPLKHGEGGKCELRVGRVMFFESVEALPTCNQGRLDDWIAVTYGPYREAMAAA